MGVYSPAHDSGKSDRPWDLGWPPVEPVPENPYKVYVGVNANFTTRGVLMPRAITWEDGRVYKITRVLSMQRRKSRREGGAGMRYHCLVGSQSIILYYESHGRWFVERKRY